MNHFLGVKVVQDPKEEVIWIGQPLYTDSILEKFGMSDAKPISTPVAVNTKLMLGTEDSEYFDKPTYQSAVGSLLYLATKTRPDITFAVSRAVIPPMVAHVIFYLLCDVIMAACKGRLLWCLLGCTSSSVDDLRRIKTCLIGKERLKIIIGELQD